MMQQVNKKERIAAANLAQLTYRLELRDDCEVELRASIPAALRDGYEKDLLDIKFLHPGTRTGKWTSHDTLDDDHQYIVQILGKEDVCKAASLGIAVEQAQAAYPILKTLAKSQAHQRGG